MAPNAMKAPARQPQDDECDRIAGGLGGTGGLAGERHLGGSKASKILLPGAAFGVAGLDAAVSDASVIDKLPMREGIRRIAALLR